MSKKIVTFKRSRRGHGKRTLKVHLDGGLDFKGQRTLRGTKLIIRRFAN